MKLPTAPAIAIFRVPALTWVLAGMMLVLAVTINVSSSGIRGGDDTGSGIGGTGRSLEPGSGLGGTGRRPFLGFTPDSAGGPEPRARELIILPPDANPELAITENLDLQIPATREITQTPVPSPAQVAAAESFTRDSSAISITEQIQRDLDSNALFFTRSLAGYSSAVDNRPLDPSLPAGEPAPTELRGAETAATGSADASMEQTDAMAKAANIADEAITWNSLASYLAAQEPVVDSETGNAEPAAQSQRLERPERIVRPELPPVQRVRPIQRAAVLPPRIKPLSL